MDLDDIRLRGTKKVCRCLLHTESCSEIPEWALAQTYPRLEYQCASIKKIDDVREPNIGYCRNYSNHDHGKKAQHLMNVASIGDGMHHGAMKGPLFMKSRELASGNEKRRNGTRGIKHPKFLWSLQWPRKPQVQVFTRSPARHYVKRIGVMLYQIMTYIQWVGVWAGDAKQAATAV